jgi:hypothetical protein
LKLLKNQRFFLFLRSLLELNLGKINILYFVFIIYSNLSLNQFGNAEGTAGGDGANNHHPNGACQW